MILAAEEVVETHLVQRSRRSIRRDMSAHGDSRALGPLHDHGGVPPYECPDSTFGHLIARKPGLLFRRNRIDVVGRGEWGDAHLAFPGAFQQAQHDVARAIAAPVVEHRVEGRDPLLGLVGVDVGQLGGESLVDHRSDGRTLAGLLGVTHPLIVSRAGAPRNLPTGTPPWARRDAARPARRAGRGCGACSVRVDYASPDVTRTRTSMGGTA